MPDGIEGVSLELARVECGSSDETRALGSTDTTEEDWTVCHTR